VTTPYEKVSQVGRKTLNNQSYIINNLNSPALEQQFYNLLFYLGSLISSQFPFAVI
jgi:hypothetical protein